MRVNCKRKELAQLIAYCAEEVRVAHEAIVHSYNAYTEEAYELQEIAEQLHTLARFTQNALTAAEAKEEVQ